MANGTCVNVAATKSTSHSVGVIIMVVPPKCYDCGYTLNGNVLAIYFPDLARRCVVGICVVSNQ